MNLILSCLKDLKVKRGQPKLFAIIDSKLYEISIDNYGTRVIQKVLEILQETKFNYLTYEFISVLQNLINSQ